jgi:hypothetical protein
MARRDIEAVIRERTQCFVIELTDLLKHAALESVRRGLDGPDGARKPGLQRPGRAGKRELGARMKPQPGDPESLARDLLAQIQSARGRTRQEIARAMGVAATELARPLRDLLEAKAVTTLGEEADTRYYARWRAPKAKRRPRKRAPT